MWRSFAPTLALTAAAGIEPFSKPAAVSPVATSGLCPRIEDEPRMTRISRIRTGFFHLKGSESVSSVESVVTFSLCWAKPHFWQRGRMKEGAPYTVFRICAKGSGVNGRRTKYADV